MKWKAATDNEIHEGSDSEEEGAEESGAHQILNEAKETIFNSKLKLN
jgi:hypothetical protein